MVIGEGCQDRFLTEEEVRCFTEEAFCQIKVENKRVLVLIPDHSRTAPLNLFFRLFFEIIGSKVKKLDYLIALGTHQPISEDKINVLFGITPKEREEKYSKVGIFNHHWNLPGTFKTIGKITAQQTYEISRGLMKEDVSVSVNKLIFDYDQLIICGPTFPHEVVGFSGGAKYIFPGISGREIIDYFHWLGAIITNLEINGKKDTPVRQIINKATSFINLPILCFSLIVWKHKLSGLYIGTYQEAYSKAADLSSKLHIVYVDKPYRSVLSMAPKMYDDLWTAGKAMYKLEPVVADGGELIIYAPHIDEISYTHGKIIDQIGYHTRDYFLKQMDKFKNVPRGVMAHSTHVKGIGKYENGIEKPRIKVTLATGISKERCEKVNLGYLNPKEINLQDWAEQEKEGKLLVRQAGEILYRLK